MCDCCRWLDKLGLAALYNYSAVCRQTYVGGNYGLLDGDLYPLPVSSCLFTIYIMLDGQCVGYILVLFHVAGLLYFCVVQETGRSSSSVREWKPGSWQDGASIRPL